MTGAVTPAFADKIRHPTAVFSGLDKITGRIISFDVAADETVQFGSLQITPRVCYTRPPTEAPQTTGFVEVEEVAATSDNKRIFSGWMFAASPGLHGVEHPVYDVWLTDCKGGANVIKETAALPEENLLSPQSPKPGTVPRPRQPNPQQARPVAAPAAGAAPGQALTTGPLDPQAPLSPVNPSRARANPVPPASIPTAAAQPRRTPTQSFFPTFANPGDNFRERDRALERLMDR